METVQVDFVFTQQFCLALVGKFSLNWLLFLPAHEGLQEVEGKEGKIYL